MAAHRLRERELMQNRVVRPERVFFDRSNPLEDLSDDKLQKKYRFTRAGIMFLMDILSDDLEHPTQRSNAIPLHLQVLACLYYLAGSCFQRVVGDCRDLNISQSSVSRIIKRFTTALAAKANEYIKFPTSQQEIEWNERSFYDDYRIPNIVGLVDGTQVQVIAPTDHEDAYVNRNGYHSINMQIVCNHKCEIVNIVTKWPGSVHDSVVLKQSPVKVYFERERQQGSHRLGLLLGDSGYACTNWLITPHRNCQTRKQERFNTAHKKCRSKVERTIGQLKRRWAILHQEIKQSPENSSNVLTSCAVLHNLAKKFNMPDIEDADNHAHVAMSHVNYEGPEETSMRNYLTNQF